MNVLGNLVFADARRAEQQYRKIRGCDGIDFADQFRKRGVRSDERHRRRVPTRSERGRSGIGQMQNTLDPGEFGTTIADQDWFPRELRPDTVSDRRFVLGSDQLEAGDAAPEFSIDIDAFMALMRDLCQQAAAGEDFDPFADLFGGGQRRCGRFMSPIELIEFKVSLCQQPPNLGNLGTVRGDPAGEFKSGGSKIGGAGEVGAQQGQLGAVLQQSDAIGFVVRLLDQIVG